PRSETPVLVAPRNREKPEESSAKPATPTLVTGGFPPSTPHIISVPAGIARMPLRAFFTQTFIGATIWGTVLIMIGYELGENWKSVASQAKRIDLVIGLVIVVALVALGIRFVIRRRRAQNTPE